MNKRILLVDDEHDVISGYQRNLRRYYNIKTAFSGKDALDIIDESPVFAAIITDYNMPSMNGIELLEKVKKVSPDTTRILITGYADLEIAIEAINKGDIYRFLTKPIPTDDLVNMINDALDLHKTVTAEKELLNQTLKGSIKILIDMLASLQPNAFNQAQFMRKFAKRIAQNMKAENSWELEIAAMLAPIGCVTIPDEILDKKFKGEPLSKQEKKIFYSHPKAGKEFIENIPRLDNIASSIDKQFVNFDGSNTLDKDLKKDNIPFIARVLKVLNDLYKYHNSGLSFDSALAQLQKNHLHYDPEILNQLRVVLQGEEKGDVVKSISFKNLRIGMRIINDIRDVAGNVLVSRGNEITDVTLLRLIHASKVRKISEPINVIEPKENKTD